MNILFKISLIIFLSFNFRVSIGSDFGTTGLIDIPSARFGKDGDLKVSWNYQKIANITNLTYQATPWLETTFRYTIFNPSNPNRNPGGYIDGLNDRSYAIKLKLLDESKYFPQIALGFRDFFGTGAWSSEYIVASKQSQNFDFTIGLGWGRLSESKAIKNPFGKINTHFYNRPGPSSGGKMGGKPRFSSFFRGNDVGIFGGLTYTIPDTNLKLLVEYNSDQYDREVRYKTVDQSSPISAGISWNIYDKSSIRLSKQQGNQWAISFESLLNTKEDVPIKSPNLNLSDSNAFFTSAQSFDFRKWYDKLYFDLKNSGITLLQAEMDIEKNLVVLEISNLQYQYTADAVNRLIALSKIHIPSNINVLHIVVNEKNFLSPTIEYKRTNNIALNSLSDMKSIDILPAKRIIKPTFRTVLKKSKIYIGADFATKFQLFDPDLPFKHQLFLKITSSIPLPNEWYLNGSYSINISNNFDTIRGPNSSLPNVRTDINKYLTEGETGITSLYFEKYGMINNLIYYRSYFGFLEQMYAGLGSELLYVPFKSRLSFGLTINALKKREYNGRLGFLDYKTMTSFLSFYYASDFNNFDIALHFGRYLAKDEGITIDLRRSFDNGSTVGAFATFTNVSADEFGEGSFDKGLYIKIPFNSIFKQNVKTSVATMIRSVQRDGGQRLEDFSGRLWHDLRNVRYDALNKQKSRMISK